MKPRQRPIWILVVTVIAGGGYLLLRHPYSRVVTLLSQVPTVAVAQVDGHVTTLTASGDLWLWNPVGAPQPLWSQPLHISTPPERCIGSAGDQVMLTGVDGSISAWTLSNRQLRWRSTIGEPLAGCPTLGKGAVLVCGRSGIVYCIDLATGASLWRRDLHAPACAHPAWWDGRWWIPVRGQKLVSLSADGKSVTGLSLKGDALATAITDKALWVSIVPTMIQVFRKSAPTIDIPLDATPLWLLPARRGLVAVAATGEVVALFDVGRTITPIWSRKLPPKITAASLGSSPGGGSRCALGTLSGQVLLLDGTTGENLDSISLPTKAPIDLAVGDSFLAAAGDEGAWLCQGQ